jgi:hypothetical protein
MPTSFLAAVDADKQPTYEWAMHNAAEALSEARNAATVNPSGAQALVTVSGGWLALAAELRGAR